MKLSDLKIETYSDQLSRKELTEVKGGTGFLCASVPAGTSVVLWIATQIVSSDDKPSESSSESSSSGTSEGNTSTTTSGGSSSSSY